MFSGRNKSNLKSRFALSVKTRCIAELKRAHIVCKRNFRMIQSKMPNIISALVLCFQGYCGHMCKKYSLVCKGDRRQSHCYLPQNVKLKMTGSDISVLKKCVEILLGHENLAKTRLQTSTQKCEAVNRAYQACVPKNVTFPRNCHGRIHGQILRLNHGHADSTITKLKALNVCLTPGSAVIRHLCKMDQIDMRRKTSKYVSRHNFARYSARRRRFNSHAEIHYKKGISDPRAIYCGPSTSDHNYA
jgi:hypothetical protein